MLVRAWDVYNNPSMASTTFVIPTTGTELIVEHVMPVPNPISSATTFTLQQNQTTPVDVEIKIYTVAGRLVQVITQPAVTDHFVRIPWDGRDRDGNRLANGAYLYHVKVRTIDGAQEAETVSRLAILR
jgi:flagellar hook assembly protein FlgD